MRCCCEDESSAAESRTKMLSWTWTYLASAYAIIAIECLPCYYNLESTFAPFVISTTILLRMERCKWTKLGADLRKHSSIIIYSFSLHETQIVINFSICIKRDVKEKKYKVDSRQSFNGAYQKPDRDWIHNYFTLNLLPWLSFDSEKHLIIQEDEPFWMHYNYPYSLLTEWRMLWYYVLNYGLHVSLDLLSTFKYFWMICW